VPGLRSPRSAVVRTESVSELRGVRLRGLLLRVRLSVGSHMRRCVDCAEERHGGRLRRRKRRCVASSGLGATLTADGIGSDADRAGDPAPACLPRYPPG
jgi:hypothetical protein